MKSCPPPDALKIYAHGGQDINIAAHISECDDCALAVADEMESFAIDPEAEVIDVTPRRSWWLRLLSRIVGT